MRVLKGRIPGGSDGKESAHQYRRCRFDPRVWKIPWRRKRQPTPVFLPGKSHGQRSLGGYTVHGVAKETKSDETTTEIEAENYGRRQGARV